MNTKVCVITGVPDVLSVDIDCVADIFELLRVNTAEALVASALSRGVVMFPVGLLESGMKFMLRCIIWANAQ